MPVIPLPPKSSINSIFYLSKYSFKTLDLQLITKLEELLINLITNSLFSHLQDFLRPHQSKCTM